MSSQALPLSPHHLPLHGIVERQVGHQLLETLIFGFQLTELAGLVFGHTAILGFPAVDHGHRDSMESRQIANRGSGCKLPENLQELLLRVPFAFHVSPNLLLDLQSDWHRKQGQGHRGHYLPTLPRSSRRITTL